MTQPPLADERPDFMHVLGLAPPYAPEDVKQAYFEKAKLLHPDKGGSPEDFRRLHEAFQQATQYVEFRASRMKWLGVQVERYVAQRQFTDGLQQWGGSVELRSIEWISRSFGEDFAQVVDQLVGVRLNGPQVDNAAVEYLVEHHEELGELVALDLSNSRVDDQGVRLLYLLPNLRRLDLSRTPITRAALDIVEYLPALETLGLAGVRLGWLDRQRLGWRYRALRIKY